MLVLVYLANLTTIKRWLWCYLIWYLMVLFQYFEADLRLWLTSFGIALVVGLANNLNAFASLKDQRPDPWMVFRFFMAPFCVSSFAAMVRGQGFVLVFPPSLIETMLFSLPCLLFWALCMVAQRFTYQTKH